MQNLFQSRTLIKKLPSDLLRMWRGWPYLKRTQSILQECPENRRDRCERCQKRGHSADYCGVILNDKVCMNRLEDYFLESDLRKVKCIVEDT